MCLLAYCSFIQYFTYEAITMARDLAIKTLTVSVLVLSSFADESKIQYYENLINDGIRESKLHEMPVDNSEYIPKNNVIQEMDSADFVIVGSGAAGSVLAKRLSETNFKIVVIEAGTYGNEFSDITGMSPYLGHSRYNWGYKSLPLKNAALGRPGRLVSIKRGKGFGGTTIISGLRYVRGNKQDWEDLVSAGNPGWSYKEMLPYFIKSENSSLKFEDPGYHGHKGPIHVEQFKDYVPHLQMVIKAHREIGYKLVDYNGKNQFGISKSQLMSLDGRRSTTGNAYIKPIIGKNNVRLYDEALVTKILINEMTKEAIGVEFSKNKKLYQVNAKKEVILCAGAINSPQILMLSGIGPSEHLKELGVKIIQNLPVGQNLIDHPTLDETIYFNTNSFVRNKTQREYIKEFLEGRGLYAIAGGIQGLSFYKTKFANSKEGPDIMFDYVPPYPVFENSRDTSDFLPEIYDALYKNVDASRSVCVEILVLHPKSRGSIKLKSSSPYDYPLIDLNLLSDAENNDVKLMLEGVKIIRILARSRAFRRFNATFADFVLPSCKGHPKDSDAFWECTIRHTANGGFHIFNTCHMGSDPKNSVVDANLKVHGVKNLRVIDASVLQKISGYPVAPIVAIAEKMSDVIKKTYVEP